MGGFKETTFVHKNLTYEDLLSTVHEIVRANHNSFVYEMKSLLNIARKIARFKIKNDRDVQFVLREVVGISKVYVAVQPSPPSQQLSQALHESDHQMFVQ